MGSIPIHPRHLGGRESQDDSHIYVFFFIHNERPPHACVGDAVAAPPMSGGDCYEGRLSRFEKPPNCFRVTAEHRHVLIQHMAGGDQHCDLRFNPLEVLIAASVAVGNGASRITG